MTSERKSMIKKKWKTEVELERKLGKTRENKTQEIPETQKSPHKMLGTTWGKANACVQNQEPYTELGLKLSFA